MMGQSGAPSSDDETQYIEDSMAESPSEALEIDTYLDRSSCSSSGV